MARSHLSQAPRTASAAAQRCALALSIAEHGEDGVPPDKRRVSGRRSWVLEVGSHSVSSFVCERHMDMRTGGRDHPSRLERCSPSAGVDVGNAVGSTASVAQPQRGIEWPAAAAWASLNRRFY